MTVTSISTAAPVSVDDHHSNFSTDDNPSTVMAESSSRLSLGRDARTPPPSILVVEGDMPSMSSGNGPSSSPEVPTTDLIVYGTGKLLSYLHIAAQCLVHVQEMPSQKFNNELCGYLVGKLKVILERANFFLRPNLNAQPDVKDRTSEDITRCNQVFMLLLALALKIESFIQGCCKDEWLQAAITLKNTAEYVSSLGFNLELCRVYFSTGWTATKGLTAVLVDNIERKEVEIVKRKAWLDEHVLLYKVVSELPSLQGEDKDLAFYLLQRLKKIKPVSTSLSLESPFWSAFKDWSFQGQLFQLVRPTQLLGKGTSATVHKAVWLGVPVAQKTFYGSEHPDYVKEAQILEGLCHPNIMSMFCCAKDTRKCSIVMELMDEDLHSFMQRRLDAHPHSPPFSVFEAVDVILQIGEGVNYLHQNGIVHRDLKSFNVLVKNVLPTDLEILEIQYVLVKVADFGFAKIKESSTRYSNQSLNIGTNRWMPPEVISFRNDDRQTSASVLQAGPKYPKKSDVYSFGMVCYEVLTGDVPFPQETSLINIKKKVLRGERPTLPAYCPSFLKDLIAACWDPKPSDRPCFASICSALKHLKCLLMSGFNINEVSHVVIGEPLPMPSENTPTEAPSREMVVRKRPVQLGELVKSWFPVLRRPVRVYISYKRDQNGAGRKFALSLYEALMSHRWSRSKFHVKPFFDGGITSYGLSFAGTILKELARVDVGLVVVTPDFLEDFWAVTELIKLVEVQKKDRKGRIRLLPLFYTLMPDALKQSLDQGRWDQSWALHSMDNYPSQLQKCRDAALWLLQMRGVSFGSKSHDYDKDYIDTILVELDQILCA